MNYDFSAIEAKWHKYWEENNTFHTDVWDFSKPKYYVLDMFPYPSGVGLHAGHPEGYTATDIMYMTDDKHWEYFEEGTGCVLAERAKDGEGYELRFQGVLCANLKPVEENKRSRR